MIIAYLISNPQFSIGNLSYTTSHAKFVPPFQQADVDKYFLNFEKVAGDLKWPKEYWAILLQTVLAGKAREIYIQLDVEQAANYDNFKELILKGYELVPEAYRQKFRSFEKLGCQTYIEFARSKEQLFDRWCHSQKVHKDHNKLRQSILVGEFKKCIHNDVRTFIDEQKAETLGDAARLADEFSLSDVCGKAQTALSPSWSRSASYIVLVWNPKKSPE